MVGVVGVLICQLMAIAAGSSSLPGHRSRHRLEFGWDLGSTWQRLDPASISLSPDINLTRGVAYPASDCVLVFCLLKLDSLVESVHQTNSVELGLDTLKESTEEGRGSDD